MENLNLYLEINYIVRQENIPQRQTIATLLFLVTVSQILVENVNVISIEISFLEEQDLSISLVRHQKTSHVMSMRRYKTQRTMHVLLSTWELVIF